jgi:beta-glucanase (GH16 family)
VARADGVSRVWGSRFFVVTLLVAVIAVVRVDAAAAQAEPNGVPGSWQLEFDEEFNSSGLNTSVWTPGWQHGGNSGPVSEQCYSQANVSQPGNGYLYLEVTPQKTPCSAEGKNYDTDTGGLVESNPSDGVPGHVGFSYSYGYVEWRVNVPGVGATGCPKGGCLPDWPALWSMPPLHETEIDTLEGLKSLEKGSEGPGQACYHFHPPFPAGIGKCLPGSYAGWHTYGADWEPGRVTYYYDGAKVGEEPTNGNSTPQFLIMGMQPPGAHGGPLVVPDTMTVDYVRVWRHPPPPPPPHPASNAWALSRANGELDAFFAGKNGAMFDRWYASEWNLAEFGTASGFPAVAGYPSAFNRPNAELDTYFRGANNDIYALYANTEWHVLSLGCCSAGDPLAFERANGELDVFFRGFDNGIYNYWYSNGTWSAQHLGGEGQMLGKPSGFERYDGELQIFFRGADNGIYDLYYSGGSWGMAKLGCCSASNPAAFERANHEIDVMYRGTNNSIDDIWYSANTWHGPAELATEAAGNPSAFERANGEVQLFYRAGKTGAIWEGWAAPGAEKWSFQERGCCAASSPSAFEQLNGGLRVFFRGTNNAIYDFPYSSPNWYPAEALGGEAAEDPEY